MTHHEFWQEYAEKIDPYGSLIIKPSKVWKAHVIARLRLLSIEALQHIASNSGHIPNYWGSEVTRKVQELLYDVVDDILLR